MNNFDINNKNLKIQAEMNQAMGGSSNMIFNTLSNSLFADNGLMQTKSADGTTIFDMNGTEQASQANDKILNEFFSFQSAKKSADVNNDGQLTPEETKQFLTEYAKKSGKQALTVGDLQNFIEENEFQTANLPGFQNQLGNITDPMSFLQQFMSGIPGGFSFGDFDFSNIGSISTGNSGNGYSSGGSSSSHSSGTGRMSVTQMEAEKEKRDSVLNEKQQALNAVINGENENVKAAIQERDKAKQAYDQAMNSDAQLEKNSFIAGTAKSALSFNSEQISENESEIQENDLNISNKESEITEQNTLISDLTRQTESLDSYIASYELQINHYKESITKLGQPTGKPEDAEKDKQLQAKIDAFNAKITKKEQELSTKKTELEAKKKELESANAKLTTLNNDLAALNTNKGLLEGNKTKLNEQKTQLETMISEYITADTKAKMDAYNKAVQNVETVKAKELEAAKAARDEALEASKEINTQLTEAKNRIVKPAVYDLTLDGIPASEQDRNKFAVRTLSDGTEVVAASYTHLDKLQPELRESISQANEVASEMGYVFALSDGYRSKAESDAARARKGNMVAPGGKSPHNYGTAIDFVLYKDGRAASRAETETFVRELQTRANLDWGGDWKSKSYETWHLELSDWKSYKNPDGDLRNVDVA